MQYTYTVILRREPEGGYTVLVPALRGCVTWGRNVIDSLKMAREAIECYLESLAKHGEEVPEEAESLALNESRFNGVVDEHRSGGRNLPQSPII